LHKFEANVQVELYLGVLERHHYPALLGLCETHVHELTAKLTVSLDLQAYNT